jgi:hypothetical protein
VGLSCTLHRASDDEIDRLIGDPDAVRSFLESQDPSAPKVRTVRPKGVAGLLLRLLPITITEVVPDPSRDADSPVDPDRSLDIDKAWHGLHFLLTGTAEAGEEPACFLLRGGEDLDDEGQARALRPNQEQRFADYLSGLTSEELTQRYDASRMAKLNIYPGSIWLRTAPTHDPPLRWLLESFSGLRRFIGLAAEARSGVIIEIA